MKNDNKIKYILYARKSSESEDRQIQSIDDQLFHLKKLADNFNLNVIKTYTESKSAKKPNNRPLFDEMISEIESGKADGILCWQINRLTRNPIDSGKISWLLQQEKLRSIQTIDKEYLSNDNVLLFSVESGMANQYIIDLRKNVKRGTESKVNKGWKPNMAPMGYLNDKNDKTIIKDPERFNIVKKMWSLMITGNYTPPQILDIANNRWGLRTRKFNKNYGGNPLSRSGVYKIFSNIFYAGIIDYYDSHYPGKHTPMITLEEFNRVQLLLGDKNKIKPKSHNFKYTGLIRCAECGCLFTAEKKEKIIKSTGKRKEYVYYHCTRRSNKIKCSQRESIREEDLERMIEKEIEKYSILPDFLDWALEALDKKEAVKEKDVESIRNSRKKAISIAEEELRELTKMRYRNLIDDETFIKERKDIDDKIAQLKVSFKEKTNTEEECLELTKKNFNFVAHAKKQFQEGGLELKKKVVNGISKSAIIKEKKLIIEPNDWLIPIEKSYPPLEREYLGLEPTKMPLNKAKTELLCSVRTRWLPG
jgi:site-specific DNA recombinase